MLKNIIPILIILLIISSIVAGSWFLFRGDALINELSGLTTYSKAELVFLNEQGFLDELKTKETSKNKEETLSLIKPATLIEQKINTDNELFEVLAAKLSKDNYQMAFKLENKTQEKKEFYLIPISKNNQAEFKEIKGVINNKNILSINKDDVKKEPLETLYDIQQHKRELNPELAKAYDDIDKNNYQAKPIKITLAPNSNLIAKSEWEIVGVGSSNPRGAETAPLQPIYLLVYGSAGGAKDGLDGENPDGTKNYKNKWLGSYETLLFDTADGDLGMGEFARAEGGYYVRTKPKDRAQFEFVDEKYDVSHLKEVHVIEGGHAYYDEFLTAVGAKAIWAAEPKLMPQDGMVRLPSTGKKYWDCARIKNHPQPARTEMVVELPPPEPPQPHNKPQSIAFDATSNSGAKTFTSSYSWSHTCTGDNRLLVVGISQYGNKAVTGLTYNGANLTSIRYDVYGTSSQTNLYYMIAPDSGSHTVAISFASTTHSGTGAISYTGAAQTGQPDAHNGRGGTADPATVTVTTVADNSWVVSVFGSETSAPFTCGNTQRWNINDYYAGSDTNAPKTPAGNQTMSWDLSIGGGWAISAASFAPAVAANNAPTISSVQDYPDPEEVGNNVTFSVNWADADAEGIKMLVCKTDAITAATPACDGGEWCSDKNDYDETDPITCNYTAQSGDMGTNNYYVFVCDDEPECSSSSSGTFTVQAASTPLMIIK